MRLEWREHYWQRPLPAIRPRVSQLWRNFLDLLRAQVLPRNGSAVDYIGILRVSGDVAVLTAGFNRAPVEGTNRAMRAAARGRRRAAVLLRPIDPIRKTTVRKPMIERRRRTRCQFSPPSSDRYSPPSFASAMR